MGRTDQIEDYMDLRDIPPPSSWGVSVDPTAIDTLAARLSTHRFGPASYDYEGTPEFTGEDWGRFVLLGVAVIWRLWPQSGHTMWGIRHDGELTQDAPAVWMCFERDSESLKLERHAAGAVDADFFAGEGELQDVPRRVELLSEVARALLDLHHGSVTGMIDDVAGDALALRDVIVETIPGYLDRPPSPMGVLAFDKLANLAVTMLAARLPVTGTERFPIFPDYMVPRHLRYEGVLMYDDQLGRAVDSQEILEAGSRGEMAIRWSSIYAAEQLRKQLERLGNPVTTPDLDYWLWSEAVLGPRAELMGPHHLCITEAY
jgi:hypothetical protein